MTTSVSLAGTNSIFQAPSYSSGAGLTSNASLTSGGISSSSLYSAEFLNKRDQYEQSKNGYQTAASARDAAVDCKIKNIVSHIENNRADKAMQSYDELLEEMSKQQRFAHLKTEDDDTQLRAMARDIIESRTNMDLEELIRTNISGAFVSGLSFDSDQDHTQENLLKKMCDLDEGTASTYIKNIAGIGCKWGICSGLAYGAFKAAPFVLGSIGSIPPVLIATLVAGAAILGVNEIVKRWS